MEHAGASAFFTVHSDSSQLVGQIIRSGLSVIQLGRNEFDFKQRPDTRPALNGKVFLILDHIGEAIAVFCRMFCESFAILTPPGNSHLFPGNSHRSPGNSHLSPGNSLYTP